MNKELRNLLMGGTALIGAGLLSPPSEAQVAPGATSTTQSAFKADAGTFFVQSANGVTACTTIGQTIAQNTITITPPAGNYVYLTGLYIEVTSTGNTTGAASTVAWTTTNLTGSPVWVTSDAVNNAVAPGSNNFEIMEIYPTGLKSTVAGTAVTIVPTATSASQAFCAHVVGYYSSL